MSSDSTGPSLEEVFVANRAQLWRIVRKIVPSADLADDVMQDAYLRIADGPCVDRRIDKPLGYCCQVVRNLALDHHRRQALESTYRALDVDFELLEPPCPLSPARLMSDRQMVRLVDQALDTLPPRTRQAFELHRLQGLTQRDIAERMGCALGLVNRMIASAHKAIEPCMRLLMEE